MTTTNEIGKAWGQLSRGMTYDYDAGAIRGDLRIADLAHSLAGLNRYNAWTGIYWSVASHSALVAEIIAAMADYDHATILLGLHDDDHEALIGDAIQPFKMAMSTAMKAEWDHHATKAQLAIVRALGIYGHLTADSRIPQETRQAVVKAADVAALEAERLWLLTPKMPWGTEAIVNPKMLAIAQRILAGDFSRVTGGQAAADRFVGHHNALLQRLGGSR